jgi:hypothetical protein
MYIQLIQRYYVEPDHPRPHIRHNDRCGVHHPGGAMTDKLHQRNTPYAGPWDKVKRVRNAVKDI